MPSPAEQGRSMWVAGVQMELRGIVDDLERIAGRMRRLDPQARGLEGYPSFLRGQADSVETMALAFETKIEEAEPVAQAHRRPAVKMPDSDQAVASMLETREA